MYLRKSLSNTRVRARQGPDLGVGSHGEELFASDGEGLLNAETGVHRNDLPVVEDRLRPGRAALLRQSADSHDEKHENGQAHSEYSIPNTPRKFDNRFGQQVLPRLARRLFFPVLRQIRLSIAKDLQHGPAILGRLARELRIGIFPG